MQNLYTKEDSENTPGAYCTFFQLDPTVRGFNYNSDYLLGGLMMKRGVHKAYLKTCFPHVQIIRQNLDIGKWFGYLKRKTDREDIPGKFVQFGKPPKFLKRSPSIKGSNWEITGFLETSTSTSDENVINNFRDSLPNLVSKSVATWAFYKFVPRPGGFKVYGGVSMKTKSRRETMEKKFPNLHVNKINTNLDDWCDRCRSISDDGGFFEYRAK